MRFLVASYGPRHVGMLLVHLHSITQSHPDAAATVYWQDVPAPLLAALGATFPRFAFRQTTFELSSDALVRISSKVRAWCRAAEEHAGERDLCFADVDTLILRDIRAFFGDEGTDVIFTHKPEPIALNSGVMLAHGGPATTTFFRAWRDRTLAILADSELYRRANDSSLGYGGADQMALWQMLDYERGRAGYEIEIGGESVRLRAEPCARLNETNSLPVTSEKHILHYKGGWQPILLDGALFTSNRPRVACWPMFTLYLRRFLEALEALNAAAERRFLPNDFGIVVPSYCDVETGRFGAMRYAVWSAREIGRAGLRGMMRRLTGGAPSLS